jgi:hypothetical protein
MPVVPTTAYSHAEDALNLARALVNDTAEAVFTDTLLMPLLNSAYRGLQRELDLEPDPTSGITKLEINDVSSPQLPTDCLAPHKLWERATTNVTDIFVPCKNSPAVAGCGTCSRAVVCVYGNGARTKLI